MAIDFIDRHEAKQTERDYSEILAALFRIAKDSPGAVRNVLRKIHKQTMAKSLPMPQRIRVEVGNEQTTGVDAAIRTAQTATQLLDHYGQTDGQSRVYRAKDYTIRSTPQEGTTITDTRGNLLMHSQDQASAPDRNNMTSRQMRDFTRVEERLRQGGFTEEPADRIRQLGNLTPLTDVTPVREASISTALTSVERALDALGKDRYEDENYLLERQGKSIKVTAKDGRGVIAQRGEAETQSKLSASDMLKLDKLEQQVSNIEQPPNLGRQEAVVYRRLMSTGNYTPQHAKVLAEEAVAAAPAVSSEVKELAHSKEAAEDLSKLGLPQAQTEKAPPHNPKTTDKDHEIGE